MATVPEAECDGSDDENSEQLNTITEVVATSSHNTPTPDTLSAKISISNDTSTLEKTTMPTFLDSPSVSQQSGKLHRVLADLKIATLPIPENLGTGLIVVVCINLKAFTGSPTDLGRTAVVVHTIKTRSKTISTQVASHSVCQAPVFGRKGRTPHLCWYGLPS